MFAEFAQILFSVFLFGALYVQIFVLVTCFEKRKEVIEKNPNSDRAPLPSVAIIVPCWNEENTIAKTVASLLALDYPKEKLDIIVVDDGSTDKTLKVAETFAKNKRVRIMHKENGGKYTAFNAGLAIAHTNLVGCLDADSYVEKDALKKITLYFENPKTMAVIPLIRVASPKTFLQKMQYIEYEIGALIRRAWGTINGIYVTPGPFSIYRRSLFEQIGNLRSAYHTEDFEIALRMHANHLSIENAYSAHVHTIVPETFKKLFNQRVRWIYGFLRNSFDYRFMFFNRAYGNAGVFSLPFGGFAIVATLFFTLYWLWSLISFGLEKFQTIQTVGLGAETIVTIDWFYAHTGFSMIVLYFALGILVMMILASSALSNGKAVLGSRAILFIFIYGLIAPWWCMGALYKVITQQTLHWR